MTSQNDSRTYEEAVVTLNTFQTNAMDLKKGIRSKDYIQIQMKNTIDCLHSLKLKESDLNKLNVVHIAGTKGKGSTSAFAQSLLKSHGYKTGLYTSPHLIEVRERIRIGGIPLSKNKFAQYFWETYDLLKDDKVTIPPYFRFLTLMAFKTFLNEKVDVAVIEVGVGGTFDATNIVPEPWVCGITSLGLDHTSVLGNTLAEIASAKGGIIKQNVPCVIANPKPEALEVLVSIAADKQAPLFIASPLSDYEKDISLGLSGEHQKENAAIALGLVHTWLAKKKHSETAFLDYNICDKNKTLPHYPLFPLTLQIKDGLRNVFFPGRGQIVKPSKYPNLTFLLDGAHTIESLNAFTKLALEASTAPNCLRILIFNCSVDRNSNSLLEPLIVLHNQKKFDYVLFCPNILSSNTDSINYTVGVDDLMKAPLRHQTEWNKALPNDTETLIEALPSIDSSVNWIISKVEGEPTKAFHVFVTGSLHLVGGVMCVLGEEVS